MKKAVLCFLLLVLGCSNPEGSNKSEVPIISTSSSPRQTVDELVQRFDQLNSILSGDGSRDAKFGRIQIEEMNNDEVASVISELREMVFSREQELNRCEHCSTEERREALERNEGMDFYLDPRIRESDMKAIVAFVRENAFVDPRVMRCDFVDDNTVDITTITTGHMRGHCYIARTESGKWVVRLGGFWVS